MQKRPAIFLLFCSIVVTLAGLSAKFTAAAVPCKQQALIVQSAQLPNTELERQELPARTIAHVTEKRQVTFFEPTRFSDPGSIIIAVTLLKAGIRALPVKDYLFYIYPSHHFW